MQEVEKRSCVTRWVCARANLRAAKNLPNSFAITAGSLKLTILSLARTDQWRSWQKVWGGRVFGHLLCYLSRGRDGRYKVGSGIQSPAFRGMNLRHLSVGPRYLNKIKGIGEAGKKVQYYTRTDHKNLVWTNVRCLSRAITFEYTVVLSVGECGGVSHIYWLRSSDVRSAAFWGLLINHDDFYL